MRVLLPPLALAAVALAGCVAPAGPGLQAAEAPGAPLLTLPALQVVEDAAGDARGYNTGLGTDYGRYHCNALDRAAAEAASACGAAYEAVRDPLVARPREGLPAPPGFDILGVRIAETAHDLLVTLDLAGLDKSFEGLVADDGSSKAEFGVCWAAPDGPCQADRGGLHVELVVHRIAGELVLDGHAGFTYGADGEPCNTWWWCDAEVPVEVRYGAPASITWVVPRAWLPAGQEGATLAGTTAIVGPRLRGLDGPADWYDASGPGFERGGSIHGVSLRSLDHVADEAAGRDYTFRSPMGRAPPQPLVHVLARPPMSTGEGEEISPYADLERVELHETPRALVLALQFKEVREQRVYDGFEFELGLPSRSVLYGWFGASHGAGLSTGDRWVDLPLAVERAVGAPGWVNLTFDRNDLEAPRAGDFTNLGEVETWDDEVLVEVPGPLRANVTNVAGDWTYLPPYQFRFDTELRGVAHEARIADDVGDVSDRVWPVDAGQWNPAQFDLTYVQAEVPAAGSLRVSMGLQDLRDVEVPVGFQAILYAAALQTAHGSSVVGYHKEERQEAGEFFCAEDTLLFGDPPAVPARDFWTLIEGFISLRQEADSDEGQGGGTGASITFLAPLACFGAGEALDGHALRAGTYLVRRTQGQPEQATLADSAGLEEPFRLQAAAGPAPPPPPWYEDPFGVSNFWDIVGVLGAALVSLVGLLTLRRRRRALGRYLREVEEVAKRAEAPQREQGLLDLRARLQRDLLAGRLSEGQYGLVLGRLDEHLAQARLEAFGEAFQELPYGLVTRVRALVGDGVLSKDDHRILAAIVKDSGLPSPTKQRVLARLDRWLAEDKVRA